MKGGGGSPIFLVFVILLGGLTGSLLGDVLGDMKYLEFLRHVYKIGTSSPVTFDLKVISLTVGLNFNMNIMAIIGVILAIIFYRKY